MPEKNNIIHRSSINNIYKIINLHEIYKINIKNISIIFTFKNYYLQYYLFINNVNKEFNITNFEISNIIKMIEVIKKHNFFNIEKNIIKFVKTNIKNFKDVAGVFDILSACNIKDNKDLDFFRKYFGYNLIYKNYKQLLKLHSLNNLPLILKLIQNNKICYNKILEIYKKLNFYLKNKVLDNGFIFCCSFFYCLLDYHVEILDDTYKEFLSGFCVYLFEIIINYKSYEIFNLEDIQVLVNLINILYELSNEKFKHGFYIKTIEKIIEFSTDIYEDQIKFTFLLQILYVELKQKIHYIDTLKQIYDKLKFMTLSSCSISFTEHNFICKKFLHYKYKVLDRLNSVLHMQYDKIALYNDLFNNDRFNYIILQSISASVDFIIDNLIILIYNSEYKIQFIDFIFKYGNISYMYLYLISIKEDYKVVLLFIKKYTSFNNNQNFVEFNMNINKCSIEKYTELLSLIYFKYISIDNLNVNKSRIYLIKKIITFKKIINLIIKEIKKILGYNDNVILLLYFVINSEIEINQEEIIFLYRYLIKILNNFVKFNTNYDNINMKVIHEKIEINYFEYKILSTKIKTENLLVNICVDLLNKYKSDNKFELIKEHTYYNFIILLVYSKVYNKNFDCFIKKMLEFIFICKKKERRKIYNLYNNKKCSFIKSYNNKIYL